jgi:DNA sulfur modification protein DndE
MKPPVETVRVNRQGREQLMKLKRLSGIEHWNSLCRLALMASLREKVTPPALSHPDYEGGVEMSWKVFAGDHGDILSLCLRLRAHRDGLSSSQDDIALTLRSHLHRGLGYLVADRDTRSISELCAFWFLRPGKSADENVATVPVKKVRRTK